MLTPFFYGPCRRYPTYGDAVQRFADPFAEMADMTRAMDRMVGSMVDDLYNDGTLQHLPAHDRQRLQFSENGDLSVRLPTVGYLPAELKVDVDGDHLLVEGHHKEEHEGQSVERHFKRSIRLGNEVDREHIRCELDEKTGELMLEIPRRQQQLEAPKQSVPIEMKKPANV